MLQKATNVMPRCVSQIDDGRFMQLSHSQPSLGIKSFLYLRLANCKHTPQLFHYKLADKVDITSGGFKRNIYDAYSIFEVR